ncbi:MAG: TrkA family potassium uptake protein [Candidatus Marinimicrobia bacterium]|nr:TrkA family potassium uptake protein [Candidatus Neomarinimicrobiota bacterium]
MPKSKKYVVIGMGTFGREIASVLKDQGADVVVIDDNKDTVNELKQEGFYHAVSLDATDLNALRRFITPEDTAIVAMGESFESNILIVANLKEIGVKKIYSRATKKVHTEILKSMNIVGTLFPEQYAGRKIALEIMYDSVKFISEYGKDDYISEVSAPKRYWGKSIIDINVRKNYKLNVVALKKKLGDGSEKIYALGFENTPLKEAHTLILFGKEKDITDFAKQAE